MQLINTRHHIVAVDGQVPPAGIVLAIVRHGHQAQYCQANGATDSAHNQVPRQGAVIRRFARLMRQIRLAGLTARTAGLATWGTS